MFGCWNGDGGFSFLFLKFVAGSFTFDLKNHDLNGFCFAVWYVRIVECSPIVPKMWDGYKWYVLHFLWFLSIMINYDVMLLYFGCFASCVASGFSARWRVPICERLKGLHLDF